MKTEIRGQRSGVRTLLTALTISALLTCVAGAAQREFSRVWKVESSPAKKEPLAWFAGDSVTLDLTSTQNGSPLDLTGAVLVWELRGWSDYTNLYAVSTGAVVIATNGHSRFELTSEQTANLPAVCLGYAKAVQTNGDSVVLGWQTIKTEWADTTGESHVSTPIPTPFYNKAEIDLLLAAATPGGYAAVSNAALTAFAWGNHALANYFTSNQAAAAQAVFTQFAGQVEAELSDLQTNPPAAGTEGAIQYNRLGSLAGTSNVYFDAAIGKLVTSHGSGKDVFTLYSGITNASDASESNLIFRLKNYAGAGYVELKNNGSESIMLRGLDGTIRAKRFDLNGDVRTSWGIAAEADPVALAKVAGLESGSDDFDGILLDRKIVSWDQIGVTYSNAVRINNPIVLTNNAAWTGWTTTGTLASNEIVLLSGQYLLSPVQSNGVARYEVSAWSAQNGTDHSVKLMVGTNEVEYPYYGPDAKLQITAGETLPGATPGVNVSAVSISGYQYRSDAAEPKYVASLRRTDYEAHADDLTSRRFVDASQSAAQRYSDRALDAYAADPEKTLTGDRIALGNYVVVGTGAWRGVNFAQTADSATLGTRFDDQIITLESGLTVVEIQDISITGSTAILTLYAQNITGEPVVSVTTNLVDGTWSDSGATVVSLGGGSYSATVDTSGLGVTGFFRAAAERSPVSAGAVTIHADELKLDGNRITGVAEIVFTNGWRIACTTNGLEFVQP